MIIAIIPALIGGAAAIGGALLGNRGQQKAEDRQRAWNEKMYKQQYSDNIELWNMQNAYNDPRAQMERLEAAGLNPNLVYGGGSGGAAGTAGIPSGSDIKSLDTRPKWQGVAAQLSAFYDIQQKKLQTDKLQATILNEISADQREWYKETGMFRNDKRKGGPVQWSKSSLHDEPATYGIRKNQAEALRLDNLKRLAETEVWEERQKLLNKRLNISNIIQGIEAKYGKDLGIFGALLKAVK